MIESTRKIWKQLTLNGRRHVNSQNYESASKRVFKIDIGNIPPNEVDNYMQKRIINKMKKNTIC